MSRSARRTFYLALLLITFSLAQLIYRLSLPTEGWSLIRDTTGSGSRLVFDRNLSGQESPLSQGDELQAAAGRPVDQMLAGALTLNPQRPADWIEGRTVPYIVERRDREITLNVKLIRLTAGRALINAGRNLLLNPGPLLMLVIALFVFFRETKRENDQGSRSDPQSLRYPNRDSRPARRLLLFSAAVFASDNISQVVSGSNVPGTAEMFYRGAFWPMQAINSLMWPFLIAPLFLHLLLSFPVSRVEFRHIRPAALALMYGLMPTLTLLLALSNPGRPLDFWRAWNILSLIDFILVLLAAIAIMAYTLAAARDPVGRAQLSWVTWGTILTSIGGLAGSAVLMLGWKGVALALGWTATRLLLLGFPVSVAIAILRYRLFDIDIILHKTMVYGSLTGLLGLIYFVSVVTLQFVFQWVTGAKSAAAIVLSTLAIAALFVPLRRAVQEVIDRRLYHRKYDTGHILANFSIAAREEVDLEQLSDRLVEVVEETMQAQTVSLWLRPVRRDRG